MSEEETKEQIPEITPDYVAGLTMKKGDDGEFVLDEEKFSGLPLEEKERITQAYHDGTITDEDVLEAARRAEEAPPADESGKGDEAPPADAETPADEAPPAEETPPADGPKDEPAERVDEIDPREAIAARKRELRAKYNEEVNALKADIEAPEPADKYSDEWEEWNRKRTNALSKRSDLRDQYDDEIEKVEASVYAEVSIKNAGARASAELGRLLSSDDLFKGRLSVTDIQKTVDKVYRPWLERLTKANGGDPSKQEDLNAAWTRFQRDPEFAKSPEADTPENIKDVIVAVMAYDGVVSRGLSPEAALIDAAAKNGVLGSWRAAAEAERAAKHEADLKAQAMSTKSALERRHTAKEPPAATGSGPLAPSSAPFPTDLASAQEWMEAYFARVDAAAARGKSYQMTPEEKKAHAAAEEIITSQTLPVS